MSEYTKPEFPSSEDESIESENLEQSEQLEQEQLEQLEAPTAPDLHDSDLKTRLWELALVFSKLGAIAFGGPAAHIAQIELEVVQRKRWLSREKLLDLLSITNLLPGPNSTELTIHVGLERAGWLGAIVAGGCFIIPAMLLVWGLAIVYSEYQTVPAVGWLLYGVKPVIIAIVIQALWKLGKSALKNPLTWVAGVLVLGLYFVKVNDIALMLGAGIIVSLVKNFSSPKKSLSSFIVPLFLMPNNLTAKLPSSMTIASAAIAVEAAPKSWIGVFLSFLKIGSVLYGGGYVLLAFVQQEFVERTHWLTSQQLIDAVAIGQFTPGPLFTTATFIGYLVAGNLGAIAGTIGIFLPAFILVPLVNPFVTRLRNSPWTSGFLDGVNAASIGLMAAVLWDLGRETLVDVWTIIVAIASLAVLLKFPKINAAWLVIAGAAIGWLLKAAL